MAQRVVELECPGCAAPITTNIKSCPKCFRPIVISTLNSIGGFSAMDLKKQANAYKKAMTSDPDNDELNLSLAFCYTKLKLYDKAVYCFEKALDDNFDNADAHFFAAVALLKGKKAFLMPRETINKVVAYINAAIMIEPKGIYYYYLAYIKYDYFKRKYLNTSPSYQECLTEAENIGLNDADIDELYELLGVERPGAI